MDGFTFVCARTMRNKEATNWQWKRGNKVDFSISTKRKIPGLILETMPSSDGNHDLVKLKIAEHCALTGQWIVGVYPKRVESFKLSERESTIPGLDFE